MMKNFYQVLVQNKLNNKCTTFYWRSNKETEEEAKKEIEAQMPDYEVFSILNIDPHEVIL